MKTKQLILTLAMALFTVFAFSQSMDGTAHDFMTESWAGDLGDGGAADGRTCVVCHIAHNSATTAGPLWNRADPGTIDQLIYTPYSSGTFNAADGAVVGTDPSAVWTPTGAYADYLHDTGDGDGTSEWTPDGTSVLCLTCHDGVGNLDAFGGTNGGC